jgi:peptide/nickel transport system substrate-binding protein
LESAATSLNPLLPTTGYSNYLAARIFQTLGEVDPQTLELVPLLIKSIPKVRTVTEGSYKGQLAYDFEIQEAAVWDDGTPITANDVIFTLKLIHHPGLATQIYRSYFTFFTDVTADATNPKKFTAFFSDYYMLSLETLCQIPIYPASRYDPDNWMGGIALRDLANPQKAKSLESDPNMKAMAAAFSDDKYKVDKNAISGSGAYSLESLNGEQGAILSRKQKWWGDAVTDHPLLKGYPQTIVYKVVKDEVVVENMLRNGELDLVTNISAANFQRLRTDPELLKKGYEFIVNPGPTFSKWMLNTRNAKLSDARVRRALAHLTDYDYLISNVQQGMAHRIISPISPQKPFYAKDLVPHDFNVEKAKALLTEAGWTDTDQDGVLDKVIGGKKTPLSVEILAGINSKTTELVVNSLVESAKRGGVHIKIVPASLDKIKEATQSGNYESTILGSAIFPGLVEFYQMYHSASLAPLGDNRSRYANPRADSLITAIRTTSDETVRNALYIKMQQLLYDEVPEIFFYSPSIRYIVNKKFNYVLSYNRPGYYDYLFQGRQKQ